MLLVARGGDVLYNFDDGKSLHFVDRKTRNYDLRADSYGFSDWVKRSGNSAYVRYLLLDSPSLTYQQYREGFLSQVKGSAITYMIWPLNFNGNLFRLVNVLPRCWFGFLGFEPLAFVRDIIVAARIHYSEAVLAMCILAIIFSRVLVYSSYFSLAAGLLGTIPPFFFISFFGDAMEGERHVFPVELLLVFAVIIFVFSCADVTSVFIKKRIATHRGNT